MTAKTRNVTGWMIDQTHTCRYDNLLVSGCSFTFNNHNEEICTWPYFLQEYANLNVLDCSQSGAGSNHIFNSIVNEIESNKTITNQNTLVVIMWSGLTRTDVIATNEITKDWHFMSNYNFNDVYSTLSIFNDTDDRSLLGDLCRDYKKLVTFDAQVYESLLKVIALKNYLENKNFDFVFVNWMDQTEDLNLVDTSLVNKFNECIVNIKSLDNYALENNIQEEDGHPKPIAHKEWTEKYLIPLLVNKCYLKDI